MPEPEQDASGSPLANEVVDLVLERLKAQPKLEPLTAWDLDPENYPGVVAFQAAPVVSKDDPPSEFRMLQRGTTRMRKGGKIFNILLDDEAEESITDAMKSKGREQLPIDYDHGMLGFIATRDSSAAAGWFTLQFRSDGLYAANIEWTPKAFESIKQREFRFTSPALMLDETEELGVLRATEVINVAITNLPATVGQRPLVASETTTIDKEAEMPFPKGLLKQLGLKEDATEEQVSEAITTLNAAKEQANTNRDEAVALTAKAVEKAEEAKAEAAAAKTAVGELLSDTGTDSMTALRERMVKLKETEEVATGLVTRVATLEADQTQVKWQTTFDGLDAAGKMPESLQPWAKTQTAEELAAWGEHAPVVHAARTSTPAGGGGGPAGGGSTVLSEADRKVMELMNIHDEAKFLEARQNENKVLWQGDSATAWSATPAERNKRAGRMVTPYLTGREV